ncbi:MAG: hypothetical protein WD928_03820 [Gammaproteobacteria bacterium]
MMSASDWPAMRNKGLVLLCAVLCFTAAVAAQDSAQRGPPPEQRDANDGRLPEHQLRSLPDDTFKPSEEISEDFPVPFPVDI